MTSALAVLALRQHNVAMPQDRLSAAVARAIREAPCSVRALARAADVPASTLVRIVDGERAATADVADSVARALEGWSGSCAKLARGIRQAKPRRTP